MGFIKWLKNRAYRPYRLTSVILLMFIPVVFFVGILILVNRDLRSYELMKYSERYSFEVVNIKEYRGILYLNDSLAIGTSYDNGSPNPNHLYDYLMVGDKITKDVNSDTITVIRQGTADRWFVHKGIRE